MGVDSVETLSAKMDLVLEQLREMREQDKAKVSIDLWEQRNMHVNAMFQSQGREIGELRTRIESFKAQLEQRRAPWWAIVSAFASGFAVFWTLTNGGN